MKTLCYFLLFVLFASCFRIGKSTEESSNDVAQVHVMNALPKGSEPMEIRCNSMHIDLGVHQLNSGDDYNWNVEESAAYLCEAIWERQIASWHAFQPRRDTNHPTIFWLVKENGFFLGWDNSTWVRKSTWETE